VSAKGRCYASADSRECVSGREFYCPYLLTVTQPSTYTTTTQWGTAAWQGTSLTTLQTTGQGLLTEH